MHRHTTDNGSFVHAQRKTREWADKGIELSSAGESRQARLAALNAEFWLERMLSIGEKLDAESHWAAMRTATALRTRPTKIAELRLQPKRSRAPYTPVALRDSSTQNASLMLQAWKRPHP